MASIETERQQVIAAYPSNSITGKTWAKRVAKWPDAQVHAVFMRFKTQGRIK